MLKNLTEEQNCMEKDMNIYSLIYLPPQSLITRMNAERRLIEQKSGTRVKEEADVITIAAFEANEGIEDTLIRWTENIFRHQVAFTLAINNYSSIETGTIHFRLHDESRLVALRRQLQFLEPFVSGKIYFPAAREPQLILVDKLPGTVYYDVVNEYSRKTFYHTFVVDEVRLLKQKDEEIKMLRVFKFLPAGMMQVA